MTTPAGVPGGSAAPAAAPASTPAPAVASTTRAPDADSLGSAAAAVETDKLGEAAAGSGGTRPADWKLDAPDGVDRAAFERTTAFAKQHGMTVEQAKAIWGENEAARKAAAAAEQDAHSARLAQYIELSRSDAEIGGAKIKEAVEAGKAALRRFGTSELVKTLGEGGLLEHPEVLRLLSRVGKAMREDSIAGAQSGSTKPMNDEEARLRRRFPSNFSQ